jgi:phage terminase small subunit
MTPKQLRFVAEYRVLRNAAEAARRAGYSARYADTIGRFQLRKPDIVAALKEAGVEVVLGDRPPGQIRMKPRRPPRTKLTVKEQRFVEEFLIDGSATHAAIRALLPTRNPGAAGGKMLRRKLVAQAIERERMASAERTRITHDRILIEYARIAFAEIGDIADWDEDEVRLKPKRRVSKHDRAAVMAIEARKGKKGRTHIRMHSKLHALDALAKHLGMWGKGARLIADAEKRTIDGRDARQALRERLLRLARGAAAAEAAKAAQKPQLGDGSEEPGRLDP